MRISDAALQLILRFEGWDVASEWPGDSSGITIPYGYDLGFEPFATDWKGLLSDDVFNRLLPVVGKRGQAAKIIAPSLRGIVIPKAAAVQVFENVTIPRYEAQTLQVFPSSDSLGADAFGGLVSLVFNRGMLLDNTNRRKEMLAIHNLCKSGKATTDNVADQVESMARLWPDNPHSDGDLHDRRIAEAKLIRG